MDQNWTDDQVTAVKEAFTELRSEIERSFDQRPTKEALVALITDRIEALTLTTAGRGYATGTNERAVFALLGLAAWAGSGAIT